MYTVASEEKKKKQNSKNKDGPVTVAKTAADLQKIRLEKLMKNPAKPVFIPEPSKPPKMKEPPEFIRNVWGSSAGAGSGDFHVYRGVRRREYARQKFMREMAEKNAAEEEFHKRVAEKKKAADERTAKKRAKRLKKKEKMKNKKIKKDDQEENKTESDSEDEEGLAEKDSGIERQSAQSDSSGTSCHETSSKDMVHTED